MQASCTQETMWLKWVCLLCSSSRSAWRRVSVRVCVSVCMCSSSALWRVWNAVMLCCSAETRARSSAADALSCTRTRRRERDSDSCSAALDACHSRHDTSSAFYWEIIKKIIKNSTKEKKRKKEKRRE